MKKISTRFLPLITSIFFLVVFSIPTGASAEGEYNVTPGAAPTTTSFTLGDTQFTAYLETGRSYSCTAQENRSSSNNMKISTTVTDPNSEEVTVTRIGNVTPVNTGATAASLKASRITITPATTGFHIFTITSLLDSSSADPSGSGVARVYCKETTLYGGYNTSVNPFNFLELSNITNSAINGTITATGTDGTALIDAQAFSVAAGVRSDIDLHTTIGTSKFGLVTVTHNGPEGALSGYVSQYSQDGDGDLVLSISLPLAPREDTL